MESLPWNGHQVLIERKAFYRGMRLTVEPSGELRLKVAQGARQGPMVNFLKSKEAWIEKHLKEALQVRERFPPKAFVDGESYPLRGVNYRLRRVVADKVFIIMSAGELLFHGPEGYPAEKALNSLMQAYQETAVTLLTERVEFFASEMGLTHGGLSFRAQKSIWGSCSAENRISLNWKLIVAPFWVMDYVVIHELAHIVHKNHSKAFWALVEKHTLRRKEAREWLRENAYAGDFLTGQSPLWPRQRL